MSDPEIGGRKPVTADVVEGETYWWCRCAVVSGSSGFSGGGGSGGGGGGGGW